MTKEKEPLDARQTETKPPKFLSDDWVKEEYEKGIKEGKWLEYPPREEEPTEDDEFLQICPWCKLDRFKIRVVREDLSDLLDGWEDHDWKRLLKEKYLPENKS